MKALRFRLNIPREEALRYYQGKASAVLAYAENGQSISFPAQHVRAYVTEKGIQGVFCIYFDEENKFQKLERISP
jgi:uncharacterized protein YqjF (DUF2071 family)